MVAPKTVGNAVTTQLLFGTAGVPVKKRKTVEEVVPLAFRVLIGFHRSYAQAPLRSAVKKLHQEWVRSE